MDCGSREDISLVSMSSMPLMYFSSKDRSLGLATLLVMTIRLLLVSLMQSTLVPNLYDLNNLLIWLMWVLVAFIIVFLSVGSNGTRTFFLEGSLVVTWTLGFGEGFPVPMLCILMILLFSNLEKASRSLSKFSGLFPTACAKVLLVLFAAAFSFFFCSRAFFRASGERRGGMGRGIFEIVAFALRAPVGGGWGGNPTSVKLASHFVSE